MSSACEEQEEYLGKCGELFLSIKGNITFHCILCEERFKNFQSYYDHILETHYAPDFKDEVMQETLNEEEEKFGPLSEEACSISFEECIVKIEKGDESDEIFEQLEESSREEYETDENLVEPECINEPDQTEDLNKIEINDIILKEGIRPKIRSVNVKTTIKDRKYKCPYCDFTGADKANIRGHIRRHSMIKPHKCKECGKAFYTRTEVKVHMRLHTGERPYLCNLCGRSFITAGKLNDHQKRHINKRDRQCAVCKMAFVNSNELRGHMAVHSDARNYKCSKCEAKFKLPGGLRNHMKLHENKRAYECKLCDAKFNQNAGLYSHMKSCHTVLSKTDIL